MEILLTLLLVLAGYFGLMRLFAKVLPATGPSRQWVGGAYWGSVALVLSYWLAYVLGGWVIRFQTLFLVALVGSGWLAGVRARVGELSPGLKGWLTFHGWCGLPAALGAGLIWGLLTQYTPVFRSHAASVELTEDFTLSDNRSWTLTFYHRNDLFEVKAGHVREYTGTYLDRDWWRDVRDVTFDAQRQTVTISKYSGGQPLRLAYQPQ